MRLTVYRAPEDRPTEYPLPGVPGVQDVAKHAIAERDYQVGFFLWSSRDPEKQLGMSAPGAAKVALLSGNALPMNPEPAPELIGNGESRAGQRHVEKQFAIPGKLILRVESAHAIKDIPAKERGRLHQDDAGINAAPERHAIGINAPEKAIVGANQVAVPAHYVDLFMGLKESHRRRHCPRQQRIVRIQKSENFSRGLGETAIQPVGSSLVGAQNNLCDARPIALDDIPAAIRRSGIDYDVFNIRIVLRKHRLDGAFQKFSLIVRNSDDANFHNGRLRISLKHTAGEGLIWRRVWGGLCDGFRLGECFARQAIERVDDRAHFLTGQKNASAA